MHIHISEKDLKNLKFKLKIIEGRLNIKGYSHEKLKDKICPNCLLKSFKKYETIDIKKLNFSSSCLCNLDISPTINMSVSTDKNSKITFA